MSNIVTKYFQKKIADSVLNELSNNRYYFALSRYSAWSDENNPPTAIDTTEAINGFQREMILGKRIKSSDIAKLIKRYFWTSGTVYAQYDDTDPDLYEKEFYVVNGSEQVYKCLFNNNGAESTVEPTTISSSKFETADGYIWKYMYTISSANNTKFSTSTYIPVDNNTAVQSAASNGAIDIILIEGAGSNYTGYISGSIKQVLSNTMFKVESNGDLSAENFYYNTSAFYITDGTGEGQLTSISSYIVNSSGSYVVTNDPLDSPALDITSSFRIAPQVKIDGDGTGAKAVCTVNTISGSFFIESVSVLNPGQNYSQANATIVANPSYGSNAVLRAIIPPKQGHGFDPATELGCSRIGVTVFFNNSESSSISTDISFRQAGIVHEPYKFVKPTNTAIFNALSAVSNTNNTISINGANSLFKVGDRIFYSTSTGNTAIGGLANSSYYFVVYSNTTAIKLSSTYEGTEIDLTAGVSETGHFLYTTNNFSSNTFNSLTYLNVGSVSGSFVVGEKIVGQYSNASATVAFANNSMVKLGYVTGSFVSSNTFSNNLTGTLSLTIGNTTVTGASTKFDTELTAGDVIRVANTGGNAALFQVSSIVSNTQLIVDRAPDYPVSSNTFQMYNEIITGVNSTATAIITGINNPDIEPLTSSLLYIDNVQSITRSNTEFEQAYLVLSI